MRCALCGAAVGGGRDRSHTPAVKSPRVEQNRALSMVLVGWMWGASKVARLTGSPTPRKAGRRSSITQRREEEDFSLKERKETSFSSKEETTIPLSLILKGVRKNR